MNHIFHQNEEYAYHDYSPLIFKCKPFKGNIILRCVHWYCKYGISYHDLEEMMLESGVEVDHPTLYRWVQQYAPEIEKRLR